MCGHTNMNPKALAEHVMYRHLDTQITMPLRWYKPRGIRCWCGWHFPRHFTYHCTQEERSAFIAHVGGVRNLKAHMLQAMMEKL